MANELSIQLGITNYSKGGNTFSKIFPTSNITVTGNNIAAGTQEVGTSAEALAKGDITTPGYLLIHNLDATNFVQVGYDDTGFKPTVKIKAGEKALFRLAQATPQVLADTAACRIAYWLIED
jgi:hypothetical protein